MKKVLMLASVASMIDQFNMENIKLLLEMGYEVHVAANFVYGNTFSESRLKEYKLELEKLHITYYHINFSRNPFDMISNYKAYKKILKIMSKNKYEFVHCHSPVGGVCARLACRKTSTSVIYTAHGFHFYKGAPLKNWGIYFPIEFLLSKYTDALITMNKEDYKLSKKLKAKKTFYIPGVGVDLSKFDIPSFNREEKRKKLNIPNNKIVILSVGELTKRKNHESVIKALSHTNRDDFIYIICGNGELHEYLNALVGKFNLNSKVKFLGFRKDINEICLASDIFVFPSFHEGLPVALMEAMASGLPVICTNIRGNNDLIQDYENGLLYINNDLNKLQQKIYRLIENESLRLKLGNQAKQSICEFDISNIRKRMSSIYQN